MLINENHKPRRRKAVQCDMIGFKGLSLDDCKTPSEIEAYNEDMPLFDCINSIIEEQEKKRQTKLFGGIK